VKRSTFYLRVKDVPAGLPKDVNPRVSNINKKLYKEIREGLLDANEDNNRGAFHLRNQGMTWLISDLKYDNTTHQAEITFETTDPVSCGIINGGHTYDIIRSVIEECEEANIPIPTEYVKVECISGLTNELVVQITGGLNSSIQVSKSSLANLDGDFDQLKNVFADYSDQISWQDNENNPLDVGDIIRYLECVNIIDYPDSSSHPKLAYSSKGKVVERFLSEPKNFEALYPIAIEVAQLHDYIALSAQDLWNEKKNGHGKYGSSYLAKLRVSKNRNIFFGSKFTNSHVLQDPIVWPLLAAMRVHIELDENGSARWKKDFSSVLTSWEEVAYELLNKAWDAATRNNGNLNAVGKDSTLWENLYLTVALKAATEK
jgi:hypothetical protein